MCVVIVIRVLYFRIFLFSCQSLFFSNEKNKTVHSSSLNLQVSKASMESDSEAFLEHQLNHENCAVDVDSRQTKIETGVSYLSSAKEQIYGLL